MSSSVVRASFRAALAAAFPGVPILPTLAVKTSSPDLPPLWMTTDFIPIDDDPVSIGSPACYRETGTFRVYVLGLSGEGEAAAVAQADAVAAVFRRWTDAPNQIRTVGAVPPAPSDQSDGRWLVVAVDVSFRHDHYV